MITSFTLQIAICETSHFYFLRNFQKISPKLKVRVLHFPRVREGMQSPWPIGPGGGGRGNVLRSTCLGCVEIIRFASAVVPTLPHHHMASYQFLRIVHRTIQMLADVPIYTAASLGPLGIQSPHTRQLRTAINIERGGKISLEITKANLKTSS